jgi:hypothetical protein
VGLTSFGYNIGDKLEPREPGKVSSVLVQWHPKDFGTLMETDEQYPNHRGERGTWLPAGNRWQNTYGKRSSSVCEEFAAVEVAVAGRSVQEMAAKWADGLGCSVRANGTTVQMDGCSVRFRPVGADGRQGLVGVDLYASLSLSLSLSLCLPSTNTKTLKGRC